MGEPDACISERAVWEGTVAIKSRTSLTPSIVNQDAFRFQLNTPYTRMPP